jgi:asparagine synthase (glutamine-hydrolysing)
MAHGREVRLPFLDHELVEFLFSLPASFKIRQGWTKWLLRKSMDHSLPKEITWRKEKVGFEPPQQAWMQQPGMQDMVHAARKKLVNENILDKNVLNKPLQNADAYDADNADWRYLVTAPFI